MRWTIQARSRCCSATGRAFRAGETIYSILCGSPPQLRRDFSEEGWERDGRHRKAFSFWKSTFAPPPRPRRRSPGPDALEERFRELAIRQDPGEEALLLVVALLLERKRCFREVARQEIGDRRFLIYEQVRTGESHLVPLHDLTPEELAAAEIRLAHLWREA